MKTISFVLNGQPRELNIEEGMRAIDVVRDVYGLTGSKESCGQGECGACTIIVDQQAVHGCLMLASQMDHKDILTIEGLEQNGELDIIQQCFLEAGAIQCGFCTPGMVMSAKGLLLHNTTPTEEEIKIAMAGNLCRCTGYTKILKAVQMASERISSMQESQ